MTRERIRASRTCPDPAHAAGPAVEVREVAVVLDGKAVLAGISFRLEPGDLLAVVGPNGAGKTTLLRVLSGTLPPTVGEVRIFGQRPARHICIAYLPQRLGVDLRFPLAVSDVVLMGRTGRLGPLRWPGAEDRERVAEALALVGISHLARRPIGELSGGEQQRMFIARAIVQEATVLLLDEPLAGLDAPAQAGILDLLGRLREQRITSIVALHELDLAQAHFPLALLLGGRAIGFGPPAEVFTGDRLRAAYGTGLRIFQTPSGPVALSDTCCEGGDHGDR
ncbi:MAG: metal ABC transporter ATP-binding protein [Candidatus Bipolaricaulis sp.]|uniref:Manganese transport system ATP-binding protein MntB n=1 Tax=Candidatus Bipolaricaulis anaerobius TaxID=2026885 RepID=A0A2X3KX73_9BACT|nr:metal ABC transporter ATP-binding protein [Candidatus Bipolaricaulis anaerobius]SQD92176.1 Manganese transport system ATP-binding protein MntB [Candidatus Bipolaricaulis anaerobius]